jgi:tetratricopeptide (TPR) repeat protein
MIMAMISLRRAAGCLVAVVMLLRMTAHAGADQEDALHREIVQLGQVTGSNPLGVELEEISKDPGHAKSLVAQGLKMAEAKDADLTYTGALILAHAAKQLKDYKACEGLFRVCMEQAAKLCSERKVLQSYGGLIDALYHAKQYEQAVRICREFLELKTGDDRPRIYLFLAEDKTGEIGIKDVEDYDLTVLVRDDVFGLMVKALAKDGKVDKALQLADSKIRSREDWSDRELKAWVLYEAGRFSEAAKIFEDVLERIAKDKDLSQKEKDRYIKSTRYLLSSVYVDTKQIDRATDQLRWLKERYPDEPGFYNDLGYIMADNDMNLQEAEQLIRKALNLDSEQRKKNPNFDASKDHDRGAYLDSLGWVLFKLKRYDDAKKYLIEALKDKDAQHIEIFDHLGDTYMALGMREAALDAWRNGLAVVGDDHREQDRKIIVQKKIDKHK